MKTAHLLFVILLVLTFGVGQAQTLHPRSKPLKSGEISLSMAYTKAKQYFEVLEFPVHSPTKIVGSISEVHQSCGLRRSWILKLGNRRMLMLRASDGKLELYGNSERENDRHRRRGRAGASCFTTQASAKALLLAKARSLGIPESWTPSSFSATKDGEGGSGTVGEIGAVFKDAQGNVLATILLDSQDGAVLSFTRKKF